MKEEAGKVAWNPGERQKLPNLPAASQLLISDKEQVGRTVDAEGPVPTVRTLAKKADTWKEVVKKVRSPCFIFYPPVWDRGILFSLGNRMLVQATPQSGCVEQAQVCRNP